jgi:hypothetical protein
LDDEVSSLTQSVLKMVDLEEIERVRLSFKAEKLALDNEVSSLTQSVSKMSEEILENRRDLTDMGS